MDYTGASDPLYLVETYPAWTAHDGRSIRVLVEDGAPMVHKDEPWASSR